MAIVNKSASLAEPDSTNSPSLDSLIVKHACIKVEFRGSKDDEIKWTDKKTGEARKMLKRFIFAELEDGSPVTIEQFSPRGSDTLPELPPYAEKGSSIIVALDSMKTDNGAITVRAAGMFQAK
jgi:hypothetical protein